MKFKGTKSYISTEDLSLSVNAAVELEKPLLIKGENKNIAKDCERVSLYRDR